MSVRALVLVCIPALAYADGLSDLKAALARSQGQTALKGSLEARTWHRQGEGKDLDEGSGQGSLWLEEGSTGMKLVYSRDVLQRLEAEEAAKEKDPKAKTPTSSALGGVNTKTIRGLLEASQALGRTLDQAVLTSEKVEPWNGKPARLLSFTLGPGKMSEKEQKYIKKYDGTLQVWIAADGTPLASRSHRFMAMRAFMVINFETTTDDECAYALLGDRLVTTRKETRNAGSGMGEKGEGRTTYTLQLQ